MRKGALANYAQRRGVGRRDRAAMKAPVVLVTAALTLAILLAAAFMIATETRGADAPWPSVVTREGG